MPLNDLLSPDRVLADLSLATKKQVLQDLSGRIAAAAKLADRLVLDALMQRESLGSTGVGQGVAIPHARIPGLERPIGLFARLQKPVVFEAIDEEPVDLVFVLLAPEGAGADHLKALARVARLLRSPKVIAQLRAARDRSALYALLTDAASSNAA